MIHEARFHDHSIFVTLTYDPDSLPTGGTLVKRHVQSFLKALRQYLSPCKIRFFAIGEYGDENLRPHYHLILFGFFPSDARRINPGSKNPRWSSNTLEKIWSRGIVEFSDVTPETAGYVARYSLKKINGEKQKAHYERLDPDTGELHEIIPEFALMSRRPGIGQLHYEKHRDDLYPDDFTVLNGRKQKVPRYYDKQLEKESAKTLEKIKNRRKSRAKKRAYDNTPERLAVREECAKAKIKPAKRNL